MNVLAKTNRMETAVAVTMLAVTADRIFVRGEAVDNSTEKYSDGYLKQRQKQGYPSSSKVIFQATRQMANDWSVISTKDSLGLGFKNQANADKSGFVEDTYEKDIFKHTGQELKILGEVLDDEVKKILNA